MWKNTTHEACIVPIISIIYSKINFRSRFVQKIGQILNLRCQIESFNGCFYSVDEKKFNDKNEERSIRTEIDSYYCYFYY